MFASKTRLLTAAAAACAIFFLPGCSPGVDGTYQDVSGATTFELHGGKAKVTMMGETAEGTYRVEGDKVTITYQGQPVEFTRESDGSLKSALLKLSKK